MKKSLDEDLVDLGVILESFVKKLDKLTQAELIDIAARLKPVAKQCEAIDKFTKDFVKDKLNHKEGQLAGGLFKALLKIIPIKRLDQTRLKDEKPAIHKAYLREDEDERVTFEVR